MSKISLKGKVILITGASRGIGRAIALKCAEAGARIAIAAKTDQAHEKLAGTIYTVADEVKAKGGEALAIKCDVRSEEDVTKMVKSIGDAFGGVDALVNNAGAISLTSTLETPMKRFDLMQQINVRAVFMVSQAVLPFLKHAANPHIINLSPPLSIDPKWYGPHVAYTISKMGMSMCTIGMAKEFEKEGIAVNSLWPRTIIQTAATEMLLGKNAAASRTPEIMADAAYEILTTESKSLTGQMLLDEDFLRTRGVTNFDKYQSSPGKPLPDLFV